MLQRLRKENITIMVILLVTLATISIMLNIKEAPDPLSLTLGQSNTFSSVDDDTLEKFINLYAYHILLSDDFIITADNKDNIRRLLNSMGEKNIRELKNIFSGSNNEDIINSTRDWLNRYFLSDDFMLLEDWITLE